MLESLKVSIRKVWDVFDEIVINYLIWMTQQILIIISTENGTNFAFRVRFIYILRFFALNRLFWTVSRTIINNMRVYQQLFVWTASEIDECFHSGHCKYFRHQVNIKITVIWNLLTCPQTSEYLFSKQFSFAICHWNARLRMYCQCTTSNITQTLLTFICSNFITVFVHIGWCSRGQCVCWL